MRQKLGQHFLTNTEVPEIMTAALELAAGDTVIEVGPGHGELTQAIVAAIEKANLKDVKLVAVERDEALAAGVRERFKEYGFFEVIEADILEFLGGPAGEALTKNGYKLIGNIPYYLTGHLLRVVGEREIQPALTVLMTQKEVAERMAANPPRMNRLAAAVQFWAKTKLLVKVGKEEFDPPPLVDSAVILLEALQPKTASEKEMYYALIRKLFAQPRKTILNNLGGKDPEAKKKVLAALEKFSLPADARSQDLSVEQISELAENF